MPPIDLRQSLDFGPGFHVADVAGCEPRWAVLANSQRVSSINNDNNSEVSVCLS